MSGPTMLAYETNLYSNPYGLKNRVVLPHIQLYLYIYIYIRGGQKTRQIFVSESSNKK